MGLKWSTGHVIIKMLYDGYAKQKPLFRQKRGEDANMRGLAFAGYPRTLRHKSLILERLLDIDKTTRGHNTFISVGY